LLPAPDAYECYPSHFVLIRLQKTSSVSYIGQDRRAWFPMKITSTSNDFTTLPFDVPPESILIVRLSAHGDVLHTLPLLTAIKNQWPDVKVGWLCEPSSLPLLEGHPLIDRLHVAKRPLWIKNLRDPRSWAQTFQEVQAFLTEIRIEGYGLSLDVQGLLKSAIWPWLLGIPNRMGFKATREFADRFYTICLPPMNLKDSSRPAIHRYLDFARVLGCQVSSAQGILPTPSLDSLNKAQKLLSQSQHNKLLIALAPFTRWESKHWVFSYWKTLIQLLRQDGYRVLLLGGPDDVEKVKPLFNEDSGDVDLINAVGQTNWPTMQALIQTCDLLVGLDSAPLHMADALGKPVVAIYGPTAPGRTGPIGEKSHVLTAQVPCQPCFQKKCPLPEKVCMTQIHPEGVLATVKKALIQSVRSGASE